MKAHRKASRRLIHEATKVNTIIPAKAPASWNKVPHARTVSTFSWGESLSAVEINSGEKKPMPHKPIIPETPSIKPTMLFRRQRGLVNSSLTEPTCLLAAPLRAAARACFHGSGSRRRKRIGTDNNDGRIPTKNSTRQPESSPQKFSAPGWIFRLISEPIMLPQADNACNDPRATARIRPGTLSATSVVAAPNMPPTPNPTRKR
jgi:hypothetical protein